MSLLATCNSEISLNFFWNTKDTVCKGVQDREHDSLQLFAFADQIKRWQKQAQTEERAVRPATGAVFTLQRALKRLARS